MLRYTYELIYFVLMVKNIFMIIKYLIMQLNINDDFVPYLSCFKEFYDYPIYHVKFLQLIKKKNIKNIFIIL
jgi:hypothetical protein